VLKRKMDAALTDNENLLTAVKYLRDKVEGSAGTTSASFSGMTRAPPYFGALSGNLLVSIVGLGARLISGTIIALCS
jgi:hypothetical protein